MKAFMHCRTSSKAWRRYRLLSDDDEEDDDEDDCDDDGDDEDGEDGIMMATPLSPL